MLRRPSSEVGTIGTFALAVCLITLLGFGARAIGARQEQARKRHYQRFLQEDRMNSTLEYSQDVTRQRRDTRIWR